MDVHVNAHSYAVADTLAPTVQVSLVDVGVADTRAQALGTFEAILGVAGTNWTGAVVIGTDYDTYAYAANGPLALPGRFTLDNWHHAGAKELAEKILKR